MPLDYKPMAKLLWKELRRRAEIEAEVGIIIKRLYFEKAHEMEGADFRLTA